ncbi:MAG: ornithine carbamoyltransferase [Fimbriimonadales bacterium]|nr:ornithine carbamoyltransferase [Fimbriimonadales bacterium]MDW8051251.1 ornithine carbamoyltransferase [Armatimonadota bacterium]
MGSKIERTYEQAKSAWEAAHPPRHYLSVADLNAQSARAVLQLAQAMKTATRNGEELYRFSRPVALALIFEKPSLRTRVAWEVGLYQMGAYGIYLTQADIQMGKREAVMDIARNLSRWVQAIVARVFLHSTLEELARFASVPVINALSDREHPCQALADLMTIHERKGEQPLTLAWVGDGNNVCHSFTLLGAVLGHRLRIATPEGYEPNATIIAKAQQLAQQAGGSVELMHDPVAAVADADVVYTDVWVSMGYETEREVRLRHFQGYQVNTALLKCAKPDAIVLHCLPARRGEEITDEVLDGAQSAAWDQAENRLHTQKALLALMLG